MNMSQTDSRECDLDVLVIGAGISGLATAWYLAKSGLKIQVWEQSHRPGGKIKTERSDGFQTEQAASMVMNFKPEVDHFLQQTGLLNFKAERLLNSESKRYLIHKGHLQPLPMSISGLFFSSLWSQSGKFRLLMEPFIGKSRNQDETVTEFITRRLGREFLEKAMEPFIAGTLASDPDLASARHVIPRLTALEKRYGSISAGIIAHKVLQKRTARNPEYFSFSGGMTTLTDHLAREPGIAFQANTKVNQIIQHGPFHWEVQAQSPDGEISRTARHVVISTPANIAAQLTQPLDQHLSQLLNNIKYASLSVVHIGMQRSAVEHPLDSSGFLVPRREKMAINGNLWMSSIFSGRAPDNNILLSTYLGGSRHPEAIKLSTTASVERVLQDLTPLLGIKAAPEMVKVDKHHQALPLYHGNYHQLMTAIEQQLQCLSGMHLEANYKGGVSVRDRIVMAQKAATRIALQLSLQTALIQPAILSRWLLENPA